MKINIIFFVIFTGFLIANIGCDDTATNIDTKTIPDQNVSYGQHIAPIFEAKCNNSNCHDDATRAGGISFTTWAGATDPNIVVKGSPDDSPLVWSIERNVVSISPMPPLIYSPLTTNQINGIKTWIKEGAENN